eukprot:scaffold1894_cov368-Prasinococcus_capsulatus_cf.AAC.3
MTLAPVSICLRPSRGHQQQYIYHRFLSIIREYNPLRRRRPRAEAARRYGGERKRSLQEFGVKGPPLRVRMSLRRQSPPLPAPAVGGPGAPRRGPSPDHTYMHAHSHRACARAILWRLALGRRRTSTRAPPPGEARPCAGRRPRGHHPSVRPSASPAAAAAASSSSSRGRRRRRPARPGGARGREIERGGASAAGGRLRGDR